MTSSEMAVPAAETRVDSAGWLTIGRFTMILAGLIFLAYPQVVTGFHSFVWRDYGLFGYPLAHYHKQCFWRGEIPLWNPYSNCGIPYLAQWGTMVLYPPSLIYLLLPLPWSLGIFTLLHQLLGGVGMFVLAQRWTGNRLAAGIAGIAFAFNGFMVNCLMWPNYTASLGWMPWVFLTVMQAARYGGRYIFVAALVGGMQMLSGTPEVILFTWLLLVGVWLVERNESRVERFVSGLRLTAIVALVAALAAAQLLPFLELLQQSNRSSGFDDGGWSLPASGWANLLVPIYRMHRTGAGVYFHYEQNMTSSYYIGVAVLVAALLALGWARNRRVWFLFIATFLTFIYGMGENTPTYSWLRTAFPSVGFMRYPSKVVIVTAFTLPLLGAYGVAAFMAMRDLPREKRRTYTAAALVGIAVLTICGIIAHAHWAPHKNIPARPVLINGVVRVLFLLATAGACWWLTRAMEAKRRVLIQVSLLMLVYFDFATHTPQQNPTVDHEALTVAIPWVKHMRPRPTLGESRAALSVKAQNQYLFGATANMTETHIAHRNGLFCNINLVEAMPKPDGFYALYIAEERDVYNRLFQDENNLRVELGRFLGFCQVTAPTNVVVWHARTNYLPLVTAGQVPIFADRDATLNALASTNFAPESVVYLPPGASNQVNGIKLGAATIRSREVKTHRVSVNVTAAAPSLVVIAQAHYPRWKAFLDGRPAVLLRANHAFQAVQVPAGDHRVDVVYQDRPFQIGAALSLLSFLGIVVGWARFSRKRTNDALDQDNITVPALLNQPAESNLPQMIGEAQESLSGGTSVAKGALRFVKGN
jgi:hypothetical protein